MKHKPLGAGTSSFDLIDQKKLFGELELRADEVFLDLACGNGSYAIAAAAHRWMSLTARWRVPHPVRPKVNYGSKVL